MQFFLLQLNHNKTLLHLRKQYYIAENSKKIMGLNNKKTATVAVFGIFGPSWTVIDCSKIKQFQLEDLSTEKKANKHYFDEKSEGNNYRVRKNWM